MESNSKAVLNEVFPKMLEELTFLFADPDEGAAFGMPHDAVSVAISFTGARTGALDMGIGKSLGLEMASNLLGIDPDDESSSNMGDDALRELMNVTCGHVLTAIAGDKPVFNLTVPKITEMNGDAWDSFARDSNTVRFSIDGRPVQLRLRFDA